jgi:hypothetical protein
MASLVEVEDARVRRALNEVEKAMDGSKLSTQVWRVHQMRMDLLAANTKYSGSLGTPKRGGVVSQMLESLFPKKRATKARKPTKNPEV